MQLAQFVTEQNVCPDLKAQQRDDAVHELVSHLVQVGNLKSEQLEPLVRAVVRREALGTTAIGRGVAVPHARAEGVSRTHLVLGLSKEGVDFDALDGQPVHAIFLVIGSEKTADEYIEILKRISALIRNNDFRRFLAKVHTAREVVELVAEMDR
jgi:mannitol/fructose-specific phosphotransferase system IIA component (Ntr-type)